MDDLTLMGTRAGTLFTHDGRGRMVMRNSPEGVPAPRVFLGYTARGYLLRFGHTVPDATVDRVKAIVSAHEWSSIGGIPPSLAASIREVVEDDIPVTREEAGPAYRFPASTHSPVRAVRISDANLDLVRDTYPWLVAELHGWWPCYAVVQSGAAVSICCSSRVGPAASEAGVETLPDFRGRGYATAVTAAWGAAVRRSGRIPLYSTSWENGASLGVARKLGLEMFGADASWG